jgi:putative transposase
MRYPASEKLEIIRLVEQSHLPAKRTLDKLGIPEPRSTAGMTAICLRPAGLEDRSLAPGRVWNRIPDEVREIRFIDLALDEPELSPARAGCEVHR